MSKCISRHGEYSEHEPDQEVTCTFCGEVDTTALIRQAKAEALREAAQMLGEAADLHDHPAHQTTAKALRIAKRRLELAADRLDPQP